MLAEVQELLLAAREVARPPPGLGDPGQRGQQLARLGLAIEAVDNAAIAERGRIDIAIKTIDGEIDMLAGRPMMMTTTYSGAELRIISLLHLREVLLGKEQGDLPQAWFQMVRNRWPEDRPGPGSLGYFLAQLHRQEKEHEPVDQAGWIKDAREIVASIKVR